MVDPGMTNHLKINKNVQKNMVMDQRPSLWDMILKMGNVFVKVDTVLGVKILFSIVFICFNFIVFSFLNISQILI